MPTCECEKKVQSEHPSPGLVDDGETVLRVFYGPQNFDASGKLKQTAISLADLRRNVDGEAPDRGFSVDRERHGSEAALIALAHKQMARVPADRREAWKCSAKVVDIRKLVDNAGERSVCVVDRALADNFAHAEFWGGMAGRSDGALRNIRDQIAESITKIAKIA